MTDRPSPERKGRKKTLAAAWLMLSISVVAFSLVDAAFPMNLLQAVEEDRLLAEARQRIMIVRCGNVTIDLGAGNAGKTVEIHQLTHAFKFGCEAFWYNCTGNASLDERYASYFSRLFNYATLRFYMNYYNEFLGSTYLANVQQILHGMTSWLHGFNATVKGHTIIWQIRNQIPDQVEFSTNASYREQFTYQHIENVLGNHTDIKIWDLVNEMTHVLNILLGSTAVETWEKALGKARTIRNDCTFIANDFDTIQPGNASLTSNDARRFYDFVQQIVDDGYAPGALGFQCHEWMSSWLPVQDIIDTFDSFGKFRIPLHITEFDPGSKRYYGNSRSIRRGPMTEASQAELATRVYTMFFSHPAVDAITWWSFLEDAAWHAELGDFMMERSTGRLLPVYDALYDLIHVQWNSTCTRVLDSAGKVDFTGFYGNYTASVEGSESVQFSIADARTPDQRPWRILDLS